ncbi:uncharacterized protein LOC109714080 [Ananas comosus]|uniref:Uncharacterized protein LOC109714080 n=1 Tax=Ananas comosus TaxID=4615 RepID=A0A6P5FKY3_ANACO|nr:uncharacterized protein LOC109714080 [Ananas comosus]
MPNSDVGGDGGAEPGSNSGSSNPGSKVVVDPLRLGEKGGVGGLPTLSIVISQPVEAPSPKGDVAKGGGAVEGDEKVVGGASAAAAKKGCLPRSESYHEQCRICQQPSEEPLVDLGCRCRGELAKAHRSCIDVWFRTKGSNKCEICQQVAANIPFPESQASSNYWVWRVDSAFGGRRIERERSCFSPLWVAFAILIGGLLLDVLISVSLGVSALPVNIIIGVLIVLGLGTALRLALECCQEWGSRRSIQRLDNMTLPAGYHPGV